MKKVLLLMMAIAMCGIAASASTVIGDFEYTQVNVSSKDYACLTGPTTTFRNSNPTSVSIPGFVTLNGKILPVIINGNAFSGMSTVESVWMKYGVARIHYQAFSNMTKLNKIHFPSSLIWIGDQILYGSGGNAASSTLTINWASLDPSSVSLDSSPFYGCSATYRKVNLPTKPAVNKGKSISKLTSYFTVNSTPDAEWTYDFWLDVGSYIVTQPTTATSNGQLTLVGVSNSATKLTIGASTGYQDSSYGKYYYATSVAPQACYGNTTLQQVAITTSNFTIESEAFAYCTGLTWANINASYVKTEAFKGCENLTTLYLDGVKEVHSRAFQNCKMSVINIPASMEMFAVTAVDQCYNLQKFTVASGNTKYATYSTYGSLYTKDLKTLIKVPAKGSIPNEGYWNSELTTIFDYAFSDHRNSYYVQLPYGVKTINSCAFSNATSIYGIKIPSSVTSMDYHHAFYGCTNLRRLLVSTQYGMANADTYTFYNVPSSMRVYVPAYFGSSDAPYCYSTWTKFNITYGAWDAKVSGIPYRLSTYDTGLNSNEYYAFLVYGVDVYYGNTDISLALSGSITIPETFTYNGKTYRVCVTDYAFKGNSNITSATINGQISGKEVFYNCSGLTNISFGTAWSTRALLGENCFRNTRIQNADLPYGIVDIGAQAFADNPNLKRINVPSSCSVVIGNFVRNCPALTLININRPNATLMFNYSAYGDNPDVDPASSSGGCFYNIPRSCKVYVPVGSRNEYLGKKTSNGYYPWRYFNSIDNGASDISKYTVIKENDDGSFNVKVVYKPENNQIDAQYLGANISFTDRGRRFYVTELGDSCYAGCTSLKNVYITWGDKVVTKIPDYAFDGCTSLQSFTWPTATNKLESIGRNAFKNTAISGKVDLSKAESLTKIGNSAFFQCNQVTDFILPKNLTYIDNLAMYEGTSASSKLKTVTCYRTTPPQLGSMVWFGQWQNGQKLYVPKASVNAYKAAAQWKDFGKVLPIVIAGDVNGDGIVSSVDVTAIYNYLLNNDSSAIVNGDQDGDGIITSVDITIIYNILLGQ